MKSPLYSVFIVASLVVAIAHCFPGGGRLSDDSSDDNGGDGVDTVLVLPGHGNLFDIAGPLGRVPSLDDDDDDPFELAFPPFRSNPFGGILDGLQGAIDKIAEHVSDVLSGIPNQMSFNPWGKIPDGANTTSTSTVVDGHIVTVNITDYKTGDNNSYSVFRVRTVDVKPLNQTDNSGDTAEIDIGGGEEIETVTTDLPESTDKQGDKEETTTQARSVETVEDFAGNEIPKNQVDTLTA